MIHKVLQEGHRNTLKDGYRNKDFLYSLSTVFPSTSSYGNLINQYDRFLLQKLDFHRNNPAFNGVFEYEEYISLQTVNDPNEGYDSILQLMDLQDSIGELQKQIFSTVHQSSNNLCKVSAMVPLITESYGIYRFSVSMLRAMYQQLGDDSAMTALFDRFESQHHALRDFYTDCQSIRFLTSLITIPRLSQNIPNLRINDGVNNSEDQSVTDDKPMSSEREFNSGTEAFTSFDHQEPQADKFAEQLQLQRQQEELERLRQQQMAEQQQRQQIFEMQKQAQQDAAYQQLQALQQQQTSVERLRVAELENDLLTFKNRFDNDQSLLQQYDNRVNDLETELSNLNQNVSLQLAAKDEQLQLFDSQVDSWTKKYEALAKLYSQLRLEHLNLLSKFKKIQQKIASAQESIAKKEKLETEMRAKNLELADIIRERDRARLELDRLKIAKDQEIQRLETENRGLGYKVGNASNEALQTLKQHHNKEIEELTKKLDLFQMQENSISRSDLLEQIKEKDIELEILQELLDGAIRELNNAQNNSSGFKLSNLLDLLLVSNVKRLQDSIYDLHSPMQAGNCNATPEFILSLIDSCSDGVTDFSEALNGFLAENSEHPLQNAVDVDILFASSELASTIHNLMLNAKGLSRNLSPNEEGYLVNHIENVLREAITFFLSLVSDSLAEFPTSDEKIDFTIDCNIQVQQSMQQLSTFVQSLQGEHNKTITQSDNIDQAVESEMSSTASAVQNAVEFLQKLLASLGNSANIEVNEAILNAAIAVTDAVFKLVKAATESQIEIVNHAKGDNTTRDFYKKNSRWTEGLISAAKAVAGATNILIQIADGLLKNQNNYDQLIVACNEVAASTAQLVAASRVKATFKSNCQSNLELCSTNVNSLCKKLVAEVRKRVKNDDVGTQLPNLDELTPYEGKTLEMEQQVQILQLENALLTARRRLAEIRKHGYRDDTSDTED